MWVLGAEHSIHHELNHVCMMEALMLMLLSAFVGKRFIRFRFWRGVLESCYEIRYKIQDLRYFTHGGTIFW